MVMEEQESDMELASERIPVPQVQEPTVDTVKRSNKSTVSRGKPRLRKKALHASIVKQMEFYFSDANLGKDRFLSNLLKENTYVDLNIFTKFNKIRELTMDVNRIAKALQKSTVLKVSEDGTQVCRLTPINKKENVDECTVYVQNLPPDADHDWLTSVFSKYGSVVYVSIPRYKSNKKIKGFAFIEFDTLDGAKGCIKAFQKKGRVLPSHTSPNDLLSITTFDNPKKDRTVNTTTSAKILKSKETDDESEDNNSTKMDMEDTKPSQRKRKHALGESLTKDSDVKAKKIRMVEDQSVDQEDEKSNGDNGETSNKNNNQNKIAGKKRKRAMTNNTNIVEDVDKKIVKENTSKSAIKSATEEEEEEANDLNNSNNTDALETEEYPTMNSDVEDMEVDEERETKGKKKKRRRNRNKIHEQDIIDNIGLHIMAKPDWKRLRNRYLELQRSKMTLLKQHLKKPEVGRGEIIIKNRSNYDKPKREKDNGKTDEAEKSIYGNINYTPGIIVKIEMDEPCIDLRSFKMEMKDNNSVKYIDVTNGSCEAYVRCDTVEAAELFVQKSYDGRRLTILKDNEEKSYWEKIAQDRQEKLSTKRSVKVRGRDKLLKKAEKKLGKCIKFDQD